MHFPSAWHPRAVLAALLLAAAWAAFTAAAAPASVITSRNGDRLTISGDGADDRVSFRVTPNRPDTLKIDVGDDGTVNGVTPLAGLDEIVADMGGGRDLFRMTASAAVPAIVEGGEGADTLTGGPLGDLLDGQSGVDTIDGNGGADTAILGADADVFRWDPGDGGDVVEGQDGRDEVRFTGSDAGDRLDLTPNGSRVRLSHNSDQSVLDLEGIERLRPVLLGGADNVILGDLTATVLRDVDTRLAATNGGTAADGATDRVTVTGRDHGEEVRIGGTAAHITVGGLKPFVRMRRIDVEDQLVVRTFGGGDEVSAGAVGLDGPELTVDAGTGSDIVLGSPGTDLLLGGDGNDFVDGARSDDTVLLGAGHDANRWDPGDGSDIVEGQDGVDQLEFNGSNVSEAMDVSSVGGRVRFFRNVANIALDLDGMERITANAVGGADVLTLHDLTTTDLAELDVRLSGVFGGAAGDGAADHVVVEGTADRDVARLAGSNGSVDVSGLPVTVSITGAEAANDALTINGLAGKDTFDTTNYVAGTMNLTLND